VNGTHFRARAAIFVVGRDVAVKPPALAYAVICIKALVALSLFR
jgi:hypothetical protein